MKLLEAINNVDLELVKKLIKEGYSLNNKDNIGNTTLMRASCNGHIEIVKELIKAGASLYGKNMFGKTALYYNKEIWESYEIQDLVLSMYPDKYKLLEETVGIHKDILLKLKMKEILDV